MYNCSTLPNMETPIHEELCINNIKSKYDFIDILSTSGTAGVVFIVQYKQDDSEYALKISKYDDNSVNEVIVGCELSKLIDYTSIFITPIDWARCTKNVYGSLSDEYNLENDSMYLFMKLASFTLTDVLNDKVKYNFTSEEIISFIFELLHGLSVAKEKLKFCHNDIKPDNIAFMEYNDEIIRHYTIGDTNFNIKSKYYPVLIDFSASTIYSPVCVIHDAYNIISRLNLYNRNKYNEAYEYIKSFYTKVPKGALFDFLQYSPLFNELKSNIPNEDNTEITFLSI